MRNMLKRIGLCAVTLALAVGLLPAAAFAAEQDSAVEEIPLNESGLDAANSFRFENGNPIEEESAGGYAPMSYSIQSLPSGVKYLGIDVSEHNGAINWNKVKAAGVSFAIIRCGFGSDRSRPDRASGSQDDNYWLTNVRNARMAGIRIGVYIYSYATTVSAAKNEAQHVLNCLNRAGLSPSDLSYPVYYDLEDSSQASAPLANMSKAFCSIISNAGYTPGIYANKNWWTTKLTDSCFGNWPRWVACWGTSSSGVANTAIWQYTSGGSVSGISGRVDMNYDYAGPITGYMDVSPTHWVYTEGYLGYVTDNGLMSGYGETGQFRPNNPIRRCEAAAVIYRAAGSPNVSDIPATTFSDVPADAYYRDAVAWCQENGIVAGFGDSGLFKPDRNITRAELAAVLARYVAMTIPVEGSSDAYASFKDAAQVPDWAAEDMGWAVANGVVSGYGSTGYLKPNNSATRAEFASMITRVQRDVLEVFTGFEDVKASHWLMTGGWLPYVYSHGVMDAVEGDWFFPDENVTRGALADIIYKAAGSPEVDTPSSFTDIPADYEFADAVSWCASNGIIRGYVSDGGATFRPGNNVTREELAVMLFRFAGLYGEVSGSAEDYASAPDAASVSSWAVEAVGWAYANGILTGDGSTGALNPGGTATRAHVCKMICVTMRDVLGIS